MARNIGVRDTIRLDSQRLFSGAANMLERVNGEPRHKRCKYCEDNIYPYIVYKEEFKAELSKGLGQATDKYARCYNRDRPCEEQDKGGKKKRRRRR
jgi:hypothetical protein